MSNYFDNPTTGYAQYRGKFNGGVMEFGEYSFTTTGTTAEVPTYFSKLVAAMVIPKSTVAATAGQNFYCDLTITSGAVTVSRVSSNKYHEFHFPLDNGQIASNDYDNVPLMVAQAAMTLTQFEFYHGTAYGGHSGSNVVVNLGKSTDDGFYLEDIAVTDAADTTAAGVSTSTFTSGTSAVEDGDVLIFETELGTTSGPGDGVVSISATETGSVTSGLVFSYLFIGIY